MSVAILVATPHTSFGELLQISLEENRQYHVRLVNSGKEARENINRGYFHIAILDSAIVDEPFIPLCKQVLELQKGIRLVIIPPENNVNHPSLGDLIPHGYITRPFYLPDLLENIERLLNNQDSKTTNLPLSSTVSPWLQDHELLRSYLAREILNTQAIAALIGTYTQPPDASGISISTGQISADASIELSNLIFRYWNNEENTDLMRFIRLASDKKDYLVYATRMKGELILIMAYDAKTPLSVIRPQTKNLAQILSTQPPDESTDAENSTAESENPIIEHIEPKQPQVEVEPQPLDPDFQTSGLEPQPAEMLLAPETTVPEEVDDSMVFDRLQSSFHHGLPTSKHDEEPEIILESDQPEIPNLSALLGSFPSPDPDQNIENSEFVEEEPVADLSASLSEWHEWSETPPQPERDEKEQFEGETLPKEIDTSTAPPQQPEMPLQPEASRLVTAPAITLPKTNQDQNEGEDRIEDVLFPVIEPEVNPLEDTKPHVVAALTNISQLEPVSPALSQINYTCVLLPRLPNHYLTGDLADRMSQWVQQICLAYGWRLEGISIRPEYLQWSVQVAPSISPGNLVRIIRQRTSLNIFSRYANFRDQNPSGDFWASGYLIVSGAQPPSAQLLREYIVQTRKRQGVIK